MLENIISLQIAKDAKKCGFNIPVLFYFERNNKRVKKTEICKRFNFNSIHNLYSAPTQTTLQKWLREKFNIHVCVEYKIYPFTIRGETYKSGYYAKIKTTSTVIKFNRFKIYEDALDFALKEGLLLISKKT
jgi:hypothetical protein